MHCYRCGRRVPDRSPRCENCGQKFNFGPEPAARQRQDPVPEVLVPSAPAEVVAPNPASGLSESIFEVSRNSRTSRDSRDSRQAAHDSFKQTHCESPIPERSGTAVFG